MQEDKILEIISEKYWREDGKLDVTGAYLEIVEILRTKIKEAREEERKELRDKIEKLEIYQEKYSDKSIREPKVCKSEVLELLTNPK